MSKDKGKGKAIFTTSKRACLGRLPGSFKLPSDIVKTLKIPLFVSTLEARNWKNEEKVVQKYFDVTTNIIPVEQILGAFTLAMTLISESSLTKPMLSEYCTAVVSQFRTTESKKRFAKQYKKEIKQLEIKENEEEASMEAKVASRILTTLQTKYHQIELRERLNSMDKEVTFNQKKD